MNFRRSVIIAELQRPEVARPGNFVSNFCGFFWKTTPYGKIFKILFRKFSPPHRSTLLCWNFVKFIRQEIGEIVRYLPDKQKIGYLSNCRYCADRAQNLPGPAPNNVLTVLQIASKSVHFRLNAWTPFFCPVEYLHNSSEAILRFGRITNQSKAELLVGVAWDMKKAACFCCDKEALVRWRMCPSASVAYRSLYNHRPSSLTHYIAVWNSTVSPRRLSCVTNGIFFSFRLNTFL